MTADDTRKAHALITYFQSLVLKKTGRKPVINRTRDKYPVIDMMKELSEEEIKALMLRYVKTSREPKLRTFLYNYDEIIEELDRDSVDIEERKRLLQETERRVREFREHYKN